MFLKAHSIFLSFNFYIKRFGKIFMSFRRQNQEEKEFVQEYLRDWRKEDSPTYRYFQHKYTKCPNKKPLFMMAQTVAMIAEDKFGMTHIFEGPFKRTAERIKGVCLKWFDEHFSTFRVILDNCIFINQPSSFSSMPSSQYLYPSNTQATSNLSIPPSQNLNPSSTQDASDLSIPPSPNLNPSNTQDDYDFSILFSPNSSNFNENQRSEEENDYLIQELINFDLNSNDSFNSMGSSFF